MEKAHTMVCICETHEQVDRALYNLEAAGTDPQLMSFVQRDVPSQNGGSPYPRVGEKTFDVFGVGNLLVSGSFAEVVSNAYDNRARSPGFSVLGSALASLGVSPDGIQKYEGALRSEHFLLIIHGEPEAIAIALGVIGGTTHCTHTIHGETVFDSQHRDMPLASAGLS